MSILYIRVEYGDTAHYIEKEVWELFLKKIPGMPKVHIQHPTKIAYYVKVGDAFVREKL